MPTGQDAPCRGSLTTLTSCRKYLPNKLEMPDLSLISRKTRCFRALFGGHLPPNCAPIPSSSRQRHMELFKESIEACDSFRIFSSPKIGLRFASGLPFQVAEGTAQGVAGGGQAVEILAARQLHLESKRHHPRCISLRQVDRVCICIYIWSRDRGSGSPSNAMVPRRLWPPAQRATIRYYTIRYSAILHHTILYTHNAPSTTTQRGQLHVL